MLKKYPLVLNKIKKIKKEKNMKKVCMIRKHKMHMERKTLIIMNNMDKS